MNNRFRTRYPYMNEADAGGGGGGGTPPTPPAGTPPAPPAPPSGLEWLGQNVDAELLGHAQNAGWKTPADAVSGHRNLERLLGADRAGRTVVLPKDDATPAELSDFYNRLGRPETADGYGIKPAEGQDGTFAKWVSGKMHELGINAKAGKGLADAYDEYVKEFQANEDAAIQAAITAEMDQLKRDWGAEYEMRRELSRRAASQLGIEAKDIDTLESAVGFSKVMKAFAKIGDMLREHGAEGMGSNEMGSFALTPEGAKAKRSQLMADKDWRAKAMVANSAEWAELQKLDRIVAGVK